MEIAFTERDGALVATPLEPRLDALVAQDFRDQLTARLVGRRRVVLDLHQVLFMDSSGLAALIAVIKRVPPDCTLRLAAPSLSVRALLKLTRLDHILSSFADVSEAIAAR
jgi:anti-sigma B factor antagonist